MLISITPKHDKTTRTTGEEPRAEHEGGKDKINVSEQSKWKVVSTWKSVTKQNEMPKILPEAVEIKATSGSLCEYIINNLRKK